MSNTANPLEQLRDIHLPEPVSWWPPAPGWWLLVAVVLAVGAGFLLARKHVRQGRYRRTALAGLQAAYKALGSTDDRRLFLEETSALLRRVAIQAYGRQEVAALTGMKWLAFLDRTGGTDQFSSGPGAVLADGHYRPRAEVDSDQVFTLAQKWIQEHRKC